MHISIPKIIEQGISRLCRSALGAYERLLQVCVIKNARSKISLIIAFLLLSTFSIHAHSRDLVIIAEYGQYEYVGQTLLQSHKQFPRPDGIGAASNLLLAALYQEVPVLVPAPLVGNIAEHKRIFDNFSSNASAAKLHTLYKQYPRFADINAVKSFKTRCAFIKKAYHRLNDLLKNESDLNALKRAVVTDADLKKPSVMNVSDNSWFELSHYLLCYALPIDRYDVKIIAPDNHPELSWYLFLPKNYKQLPSLGRDLGQDQGPADKDLDESVGLAISALPSCQDCLAIRQIRDHSHKYADYFLAVLNKLFLSKHRHPEQKLKAWNLYFMGHGISCEKAKESVNYEKKRLEMARDKKKKEECQNILCELEKKNLVCSLSIGSFQKFLLWCEEYITTKVLFYSSCSSGGKQALDSFCCGAKPLALDYLVMSDTFSEAPSQCAVPMMLINFYDPKATHAELMSMVDWNKRVLTSYAPV